MKVKPKLEKNLFFDIGQKRVTLIKLPEGAFYKDFVI